MFGRVFVAALCLDAASAAAQERGRSGIAGEVRDSAGRPIGGTDVTVGEAALRVRSDSAGRFWLGGLTPGVHMVYARRIGFLPVDTSIRVVADSAHPLLLVLARRPTILDTVVVTETCREAQGMLGFQCRQRAGQGVFLEVDSIDALDAGYRGTGDLFRERKGFRMEVSKSGVRYPVKRGGCLTTLINGRPNGGWAPWYLSEIVAVEIYDEPSKVPKQFEHWTWAGAEACSLVIYWTTMRGRRPP